MSAVTSPGEPTKASTRCSKKTEEGKGKKRGRAKGAVAVGVLT